MNSSAFNTIEPSTSSTPLSLATALSEESREFRKKSLFSLMAYKAQLLFLFLACSVGLLAGFSLSLWLMLFAIALYFDSSGVLLPKNRYFRSNYELLIVPTIFLMLCLISITYSPEPGRGLREILGLIGMFILGIYLMRRPAEPHSDSLKIVVWGFISGIMLLIIEYMTNGIFYNFFNDLMHKEDRFLLFRLNRNAVAIAILMWAVISYNLSVKKYWLAGMIYIASAICIMSSECESAKLGLVVGSLVFISCYLMPRFIPRFLVILLPMVLLFLPAMMLLIIGQEWFIKWAQDIAASFVHRIFVWKNVANLILQKPLLGWGFGAEHAFQEMNLLMTYYGDESEIRNFPLFPSHPHNLALQICLEVGFIGYILYVISVTSLFEHLTRKCYPRNINAVYFTTLISFLVICQTSYNIWSSWLLASLIFALYFIKIYIPLEFQKLARR